MSGDRLLDTNAAIDVLNDRVDLTERSSEGQHFLCVTVVGELLYGAAKSSRPEANRQKAMDLVRVCGLLRTTWR